MLDAQTLPFAATHRCAALVTYGMLPSVPPHSLGRWGCLKCRGGRIEFGHLVRHLTQAFTLTPLHGFTLAQLRTDNTTASYGYCCLARRKKSQLNPEMVCFRFRNAEPTDTTFWNLLRSVTNMYDAHSCQGVVEFFWDLLGVTRIAVRSLLALLHRRFWKFDLSFISSVNDRYYVTWY